jgi:hypothetical protein
MHFFILRDFQFVVLGVFLGLTGAIILAAAFGGHLRRPEPTQTGVMPQEEEIGTPPRSENNPIAPWIIFTYVWVILWAIGYLWIYGVKGHPF